MLRLFYCVALLLIALPVSAQVKVSVRLDETQYLVGEPIVISVDVTNVGKEAVEYGAGKGTVQYLVLNGAIKTRPNIWGCDGERRGVAGFGGNVDHLPLLQPGQTTTFHQLVRGYQLGPGQYDLRVFGNADVQWRYLQGVSPNDSSAAQAGRRGGDLVEGTHIDAALRMVVAPSDEESLRRAFDKYVRVADVRIDEGERARSAIVEMAPWFLREKITGFLKERLSPVYPARAADALADINTAESRQDLRQLYSSSTDFPLRQAIVLALAGTGARDNLAFFQDVVNDHGTGADDNMRMDAVYGIGYMHGDEAAEALRRAPKGPSQRMRNAVVFALGNTQSPNGVDGLIDALLDISDLGPVCTALKSLTHMEWCSGPRDVVATRSRWQRWWEANRAGVVLYGQYDCPVAGRSLPAVPVDF